MGAEFRSLGHRECIRLKKKIPGVPVGAAGCKIQDPGTCGMHQTKKKISWYASRVAGCRIQDLGTYGIHQTKNTKFLVYRQGLQGVEFRPLEHMECIRNASD